VLQIACLAHLNWKTLTRQNRCAATEAVTSILLALFFFLSFFFFTGTYLSMQILLAGPSLSFLEHILNTAAVVQRVAVHVTYCCESRLRKSWLSFFVRFRLTWPPADLIRHHPSALTYSSFWWNSCFILLPFSSQLHAGPCIIDIVSWGVPCFMQIMYLAMLLQ